MEKQLRAILAVVLDADSVTLLVAFDRAMRLCASITITLLQRGDDHGLFRGNQLVPRRE
jgi:uncharacterized protein (DUF58 family)